MNPFEFAFTNLGIENLYQSGLTSADSEFAVAALIVDASAAILAGNVKDATLSDVTLSSGPTAEITGNWDVFYNKATSRVEVTCNVVFPAGEYGGIVGIVVLDASKKKLLGVSIIDIPEIELTPGFTWSVTMDDCTP